MGFSLKIVRQKKFYLFCAFIFIFSACGSTRKISRVGVRQPSSVDEAVVAPVMLSIEERRTICQKQRKATQCSKSFLDSLAALCSEKIEAASCPAVLSETITKAQSLLLGSERSMLEELTNRNCNNLTGVGLDRILQNFLWSYQTSGPYGRRRHLKESLQSQSAQFQLLSDLEKNLRFVLERDRNLENRMSNEGEYVIPEKYLPFYEMLLQKSCSLEGNNLTHGFQVVDDLDKLAAYSSDKKQRDSIEKLSSEIRQMINKNVGKLF